MLTTLYLVRHAHPLQNSGIAYDRVPGPPLDDIGRAEAARTAQFLRNCGLHALLCSPLERTRQTAAAISAATGITAVIDDALAEHRSDERFEDVSTRTAAWLARIENGPHSVLAAVTHGSPIRALLKLLSHDKLDLTRFQFAGGNPAPTAGVWRADKTGSTWQIALVFEAQHTPTVSTHS